MILESLDITSDRFATETGWEVKPEGACKGDVCVPLAGHFGLATTAERLGMAVVHDASHGVWAIGPESLNGRALVTAQAPDLTLKDLDGNDFHLRSLRGRKVVLVAWAPY